ncbi:MAG TPA: hypothetical protein VIV60_17270 [Polyangiaceae bacterium]
MPHMFVTSTFRPRKQAQSSSVWFPIVMISVIACSNDSSDCESTATCDPNPLGNQSSGGDSAHFAGATAMAGGGQLVSAGSQAGSSSSPEDTAGASGRVSTASAGMAGSGGTVEIRAEGGTSASLGGGSGAAARGGAAGVTGSAVAGSVGNAGNAGDAGASSARHILASVAESSLRVVPGQSASVTVSVTRNGTGGVIRIQLQGLPPGTSANYVDVPSGSNTAMLQINATAATKLGGPYLLKLSAESTSYPGVSFVLDLPLYVVSGNVGTAGAGNVAGWSSAGSAGRPAMRYAGAAGSM